MTPGSQAEDEARPGLEDASERTTLSLKAENELTCPRCSRKNPADARFCFRCGLGFGGDALDEPNEKEADPLIGRVIDRRYRIEELLGRGGMGVVYRVEHIRMAKVMAMKMLSGSLGLDRDVIRRFEREVDAVSRLDHPNTVQVFDSGRDQGMTYLVMEYLPGRDLGQLVKEDGPLDFAQAARFGVQIAGSVHQAHQLGIVHRDLKPENVMLLEESAVEDFVKVLDFGLAKLRDESGGDRSITRAGAIVGTPFYMAPEHIRGEGEDARSDVYAMGALLYKLITGVPPFWAASPVGVLTLHLTEDLVLPSARAPNLAIPPEADRILAKALEKEASNRYATMHDFRAALLAFLSRVGGEEGLSSANLLRVEEAHVPARDGGIRALATRSDVDRYERGLRARNLAFRIGLVGLLSLLVVGAGWAWVHRPQDPVTTETEPNDELVDADPLPEGVSFTAYLGRRMTESRSDSDIYVIEGSRARRDIRIEVSAIRNMDIVVEVFRRGGVTPLLTADSGGVGMAETVPNFAIEGPIHYLRVRELWRAGIYPTENVSDPYTIRWSRVPPDTAREREVNDSLELADDVSVGEERHGYIGWGGDEDVYCLAEEATAVVASVEGVPGLDLALERVERVTGRVTRFDTGGVGEGETTSRSEAVDANTLCFEVSADPTKDSLANAPNDSYRFIVRDASGE